MNENIAFCKNTLILTINTLLVEHLVIHEQVKNHVFSNVIYMSTFD